MSDAEDRSQPAPPGEGAPRVSLDDVELTAQQTKTPLETDRLPAGHPDGEAQDAWPDARDEQESLQQAQRREDLEGQRQDREQRKAFATKIYLLVKLWLLCMLLLLLVQGMGRIGWVPFRLADSAAIGGTTVNVIGIFIVVARYLFPDHGSRTWRTGSER